MSQQLPNWTADLKPLYCAWRLEKRNNRRRMHWYRRILDAKLALAESGVCQEKIRIACRFLSNADFMRGSLSKSAKEALDFLNEPDVQLFLDL